VRVDGGRFFRGEVVKVERIDLYDFKVILAESSFEAVKRIAEHLNITIERAFALIIANGIDEQCERSELKET